MYDELERLHRTYLDWVKGAEESILRGTSIKDMEDYRVRVSELRCYQRAAKEIEVVKTRMLKEE